MGLLGIACRLLNVVEKSRIFMSSLTNGFAIRSDKIQLAGERVILFRRSIPVKYGAADKTSPRWSTY
jgi:hypothetical protein